MRKRTEREEFIRSVAIPEATESYEPLSHGQQIDLMLKGAAEMDFQLKGDVICNWAKDGLEVINTFNFVHPDVKQDADIGIRQVGINSYNKKKSAKIAYGGNVWACTNGMIVADYIISRKHTPGNETSNGVVRDFKGMVERSLVQSMNQFEELVDTKERMKAVQFDTKTTAWLVDQLFYKEEMLTMNQFQALKKEMYLSQDFAIDAHGNLTLWNFYNNVTEVLKNTRANQMTDRHMDLHTYTMTNLIEGKF